MAKIKHLTEYHRRAIELKYKGNSYQDIAEKLSEYAEKSRISRRFTEQTIKDWFKDAGPLHEAYRLYEEEMDGIHRETLEVIKKAGARVREDNFRLANEMLVALMGSEHDNVKLGAIKELLDRVEGQPKQFLDIKKTEVGLDLLKHEHRLKKIRGK
jgi:trimethylamine:corrinoid methyltransferase-like protein